MPMEPNRRIRSIVLVMLPIVQYLYVHVTPFSFVTFPVHDLPPMPFYKNRAQQVVP